MKNEEKTGASIEKPSSVDVELIEKILEKSLQKKIVWERSGNAYTGRAVKGTLAIAIQRQPSAIFGTTWREFSVQHGPISILKLDNDPLAFVTLSGASESLANKKVSELVAWLDSARLRQVKEAISELDQL